MFYISPFLIFSLPSVEFLNFSELSFFSFTLTSFCFVIFLADLFVWFILLVNVGVGMLTCLKQRNTVTFCIAWWSLKVDHVTKALCELDLLLCKQLALVKQIAIYDTIIKLKKVRINFELLTTFKVHWRRSSSRDSDFSTVGQIAYWIEI